MRLSSQIVKISLRNAEIELLLLFVDITSIEVKMWKTFCDVFNALPLAATIDDKIFCVHAGISPEIMSDVSGVGKVTAGWSVSLLHSALVAESIERC